MDFDPGEARLALRRLAADFARREILPLTDAIDREKSPEKRFPAEILAKSDALGLRTLAVPEDCGGGGADSPGLCLAAEELGWGDLGVAVIHALDWALSSALLRLLDEAEFRAFAADFTGNPALHLAHAALAPEAGNPAASGGSAGVSLTEDADGWRLNGAAPHVLNGAAAGFLLLESHLPEGSGRRIFLARSGRGRGIEVARHHDSMGMRSCPDVDLRFQDARLARRERVDCAEEAWRSATRPVRVLPAAAAVGAARKAHENALAHARERVQGGKPIIGHQTVGFMLCDSLVELDAARRSLQAAAREADRAGDADPWRSLLVPAFAAESCERAARRSMEVWGGAGYMTEAPMERLLRDLTAFSHALGGGNAMRAAAMRLL